MSAPDRLVPEAERRRITGVARSTWFVLEREGLAPKRRLVTQGRVAWLETELVDWVRSRPVAAPPAPERALDARLRYSGRAPRAAERAS